MRKRIRLDKTKCVIGIDPGLDGAIAFLYEDGTVGMLDVPTFEDTRGRQVDLPQLIGLFRAIAKANNHVVEHAFIEKVHSMPKQGISSAFKFGRTLGHLEMLIIAFDIPNTHVTPQEWKKGLKVQKHKDASRARASQLMPGNASLWKNKKDHNRADAALIAYYGKTMLGG